MNKFWSRLAVAVAAVGLTAGSTVASAAIVSGPNMDPNAEGLAFGSNDAFVFGGYGQDDARVIEGNDVLAQSFAAVQNAGLGNSVPVAGNDPVFTTIGNGSGALDNGNVIRYSVWMRNDPLDPMTIDPAINPVVKIEFHGNQLDGSGSQKLLDTDINGQGAVFTSVSGLATNVWTLVSHEYEVDEADWGGNVGDVMEIRNVVFAGDFSSSFGGANSNGTGTLLTDHYMVEIFADANAVTPLVNPAPPIPEPASLALIGLGLSGLLAGRRIR